MTEADWNACKDQTPLLTFLRGKASRRKIGLWVVACYRALCPVGNRFLEAVGVVERYAEGEAAEAELETMHQTWHTSLVAIRNSDPCDFAGLVVQSDFRKLGSLPAALLRDIFGNPFRPVAIFSSWLAWNDGTVRKMAQVIYDDRAFDRLPLLADALEDAGCDSREILDHCRSGGDHVRGCWVVDLLLGKS